MSVSPCLQAPPPRRIRTRLLVPRAPVLIRPLQHRDGPDELPGPERHLRAPSRARQAGVYHRRPARPPGSREQRAVRGIQPLEHLLAKDLGQPLEQPAPEQRRRVRSQPLLPQREPGRYCSLYVNKLDVIPFLSS